ncbi:MAG: DUF4838 domain-containing protein, partial [Armatimonadetes bacterium]|nr:DUF4838 domain-containing protein [Armatimonadota bacterium]
MKLLLGLLLGATTVAPAADLTLTRDGQATSTIVLPSAPTRAAQFAARELQYHLRLITGAEVPIIAEGATAAGVAIYLGDTAAARALGLGQDKLGSQEYAIRVGANALVLVGRDKTDTGAVAYSQTPTAEELATWPGIWDAQGTMYAVYDFLERCCDVRWFTPTEVGTDCPRRPTLTIAGTTPAVRRAPYFRYRYAAYPPSESYDQYTGLWRAGSEGYRRHEAAAFADLHQRFTDASRYTEAKRGAVTLFRLRRREGGEICLGNHSLYGYYRRFWEPEKDQEALFEAKHADWFAQGYAGRPPQMCYSSRGLVAQVAKDACEFFETGKSYPGAQAGGDCFCVEPMDNDSFCQCAACRRWLTGRDADSPFFSNGRHSDYFFQFVNEVAKIVRVKHPDKRIVCLAYMTHAAPPERLKLEPNVLVQYCFAANRLNYDRATYDHEVAMLRQWRRDNPTRDLYLWLYDTFPVEIAVGGDFYCFPGFFGHTVGEQFRLFREQNYRGIFHCGYGQEVEAYLTYRLMDDPSLDAGRLMDEYFQRLYGPAAAPMQALYNAIERTYGTPANYQESIASGRLEMHHHQTEEMAWGYLGTEARMAQMAELMGKARDAAQTPEEKRRVELFELGTWDYMLAGRAQYLKHAKERYGGQGAPLRVPYAASGSLGGDPARLDRGEALALAGWRSRQAEPTQRKCVGWAVNDGQQLYLRLEEPAAPAVGDRWEVLLSASRPGPLRTLTLTPDGKCAAR